MDDKGFLERKVKREVAARKQAETLLEQKSLELYEANQQLKLVLGQLESQNLQGLKKLEFEGQVSEALIHFGRAFLSRSLDDGLLLRFLERLSDNTALFTPNIYLLPNILSTVLGTEFGVMYDAPPKEIKPYSFWVENRLYVPLEVDHKAVGQFSVEITDIEPDFAESQMTLVVELICSAISRQNMVTKTQQARKRAEESERSTKEFVAMINHELRTPLNGLLGSAELLADTSLNSDQRNLLSNLTHSGDMLRHIINDLLDFSKMNAGMMELFPSQFTWQELKAMLNGIFAPKAQEKRIAFLLEESGDIPGAFVADFERLSQVLVNLIGNAIKFTSFGKVEVLAKWEDDQLKISVEDTGCGIPQEAQAQLFDPFVQADRTAKRNFEGTGLGLAICSNLVQLMKGTLGFESELGEGSIFTVCLPLELAESVEVTTKETELTHPVKALESLTILVVDDIRMNQIIIKQMLKKFSIEPDVATNGLEAIHAAEKCQYDLIFMDCRMPEMDGFEATNYLREHDYQSPIIALTAGTTLEERERCIESGMDDILTKPYTAVDLKSMIQKWM
ncbi:ATP-binding protein [Vibrio sp. LaRot3]|uniref:ATP-binding protein n=1 Tax=Vibrio sp. LaRot3 TaxID=2998829 RepID=UPI0022CE215A|nr:ATP-binding protein [Vibrio sp. LaRot3]MDA0147776.1 ATP-binding protein [Vibrio sp. LaRot3]